MGRIHSEAKLAFASGHDKRSYLGVYIFVVFNSGKTCVIIGGVQPVSVTSTRCLSEENSKNLGDCK